MNCYMRDQIIRNMLPNRLVIVCRLYSAEAGIFEKAFEKNVVFEAYTVKRKVYRAP